MTWNFDLNRTVAKPSIRVTLDLETYLIAPLVQAPPIVCVGFSVDGGKVHIVAANDPAFDRTIEAIFSDARVLVVAHNARFEIASLLAHGALWGLKHWPAMLMGALHDDRVTCTLLRETLLHIATADRGLFGRKFNLGACAEIRKLPTQPDKTDPWRLKWGTLADLSAAEYPAEATKYLVEDVRATDELYLAQAPQPAWLVDQYRQTRASVALSLMSAWGLATDQEQVERLYEATLAEYNDAVGIATAHGLICPKKGSRSITKAAALVTEAWAAKGQPPPRKPATKLQVEARRPGAIRTDEEVCAESGHPGLVAFSRVTKAQALLKKVERLRHPVIQPYFNSLMETGRTSCSQGSDPSPGEAPIAHGAQVQNPDRAAGLRECYVARPGSVFLDIDYNIAELRALAQVEHLWFGSSALGDVLNDPKRDPHVEIGAAIRGLTAEQGYALKAADPKDFKAMRQLGKVASFGCPGGLGAKRLVDLAKSQYGVTITEEEAKNVIATTKRVYPERGRYLARISDWTGQSRSFRFTHPYSGRVRGGLGYTDGANNPFQGLSADFGKEAIWRIAVHCYVLTDSALYGCRPVNYIHDQVFVESPEGSYREAAAELQRQWVGAAQEIVPDILILAEPAAMRRWDKNAGDAVYDSEGRLAIYPG